MSFISKILEKFGVVATQTQAEDFEKWLVHEAWKKYSEEKMNHRIVIENRIKSECNLRVPNGTVRKEYLAQIELPLELVEDAWFDDSVETLGLSWTLETDANLPVENSTELVAISVDHVNDETANGLSDNEDVQIENSAVAAECVEMPTTLILKITGKPTEGGDFTITLHYKYKGWIEGDPISTVDVPIAINPDPRSLWKNIPTDKETTSFFKEDSVCDYIKVEAKDGGKARKDIVVASQRGRSHAQEGKPRDDHYNVFHCDESDWYVLSVADGAGSAKYSRKGSQIACDTVVEFCKEQLMSNEEFEAKIKDYQEANDKAAASKVVGDMIYKILGTAAHKAYKAINDFAADKAATNPDFAGVKTKDFATTLLLAICKKFDFGWFVATFWVGDGAMCIYNADKNTIRLLGEPDEGEFSGQTRFLTMPEIFTDATSFYQRLRFSIEDDFTALFLMTDGVSDPMFETDVNLKSIDKWHHFYNSLRDGFPEDQISGVELTDDNEESKYQLLHWLDFWSPGNHDDRTIAILY